MPPAQSTKGQRARVLAMATRRQHFVIAWVEGLYHNEGVGLDQRLSRPGAVQWVEAYVLATCVGLIGWPSEGCAACWPETRPAAGAAKGCAIYKA